MKLLTAELTDVAFRMYVCDEDGFQKSANIIKYDNDWIIQPEYANKNWSWRPYFLENIIKMRNEKKEFYLIYIVILKQEKRSERIRIL